MYIAIMYSCKIKEGRRGRYHLVVRLVQLVSITTKVMRSNPVHGEMYLIQHYVIKFVSYLRQVGDFLLVLRFTSLIKLTATI